MEYSTIFSSFDSGEISIVKHLLEDHKVEHKILGEVTSGVIAGAIPTRVQVREDHIDKAKAVLLESGFLGEWKKGKGRRRRRSRAPRWILILLAALVLIIVAFLVMWFMNPK